MILERSSVTVPELHKFLPIGALTASPRRRERGQVGDQL